MRFVDAIRKWAVSGKFRARTFNEVRYSRSGSDMLVGRRNGEIFTQVRRAVGPGGVFIVYGGHFSGVSGNVLRGPVRADMPRVYYLLSREFVSADPQLLRAAVIWLLLSKYTILPADATALIEWQSLPFEYAVTRQWARGYYHPQSRLIDERGAQIFESADTLLAVAMDPATAEGCRWRLSSSAAYADAADTVARHRVAILRAEAARAWRLHADVREDSNVAEALLAATGLIRAGDEWLLVRDEWLLARDDCDARGERLPELFLTFTASTLDAIQALGDAGLLKVFAARFLLGEPVTQAARARVRSLLRGSSAECLVTRYAYANLDLMVESNIRPATLHDFLENLDAAQLVDARRFTDVFRSWFPGIDNYSPPADNPLPATFLFRLLALGFVNPRLLGLFTSQINEALFFHLGHDDSRRDALYAAFPVCVKALAQTNALADIEPLRLLETIMRCVGNPDLRLEIAFVRALTALVAPNCVKTPQQREILSYVFEALGRAIGRTTSIQVDPHGDELARSAPLGAP